MNIKVGEIVRVKKSPHTLMFNRGRVGIIFAILPCSTGVGVDFMPGISWFNSNELSSTVTNKDNIMFEYHRDPRRNPIGVLSAKTINGVVHFGWSLCKKSDRFDRDFGKSLADIRCEMDVNRAVFNHLPHSMFNHFSSFHKRASKYFKNAEVPLYEFLDSEGSPL